MVAPNSRREAVSRAAARAVEQIERADAWRSLMGEVLASVGQAAEVDRAYLFQNRRGPDGRLWMCIQDEWHRDDVGAMADDPTSQMRPYHPGFDPWIEQLSSRAIVQAGPADLPTLGSDVLLRHKIGAVVLAPVFVGEEWWGFVGFDDRDDERPWDDDEAEALLALTVSIAGAIARDRSAEADRIREDPFEALINRGPAISYVDDTDERASTLYISPQVEALLGYSCEEWTGNPDLWVQILHPDDRPLALAENARHNETGEPFRLEYRMFAKDGKLVWVRDEATLVRDEWGAALHSIGVMLDITDRKRAEEKAMSVAYNDELTGLASRSMFEELLALSIQRAERHESAVAVVVVDIDDFRLVNDSLGHPQGDEMLKMVSDRLREATRETDLVARRGGDRFLLLLSDLPREGGTSEAAMIRVESVAQRVQESMMAPFELAGTELYSSVSIGASVYPQDAHDAGALVRNAEAAMYEAKKGGSGSSGYVISSRGTYDSAAKLQFVTRLRKAVESQRWTLYYQPVIELATGQMTGVEALIRWIEPDGTMVPPSEFIPLAEELGLIEHIGDWVVRELVYQVLAWRELDIDLEVGFNLSPRQFWQPDLAERILRQIRGGGLDPSRIIVEVTESSAMLDPDRAQGILLELRGGGLSIAIDDFGTGYSSLSRLREMPVRVLKIDRSFVSAVDEDPQAASIVSAFLELARGLGMTTLAEGIETEGELAFLREHGCELGQGFLFSKPVPPEEIIAYSFGGVPMPASLRVG
jgi:diguanylate cyclase (GGDEF)-like protein/PAS domain S-box-containing protein